MEQRQTTSGGGLGGGCEPASRQKRYLLPSHLKLRSIVGTIVVCLNLHECLVI